MVQEKFISFSNALSMMTSLKQCSFGSHIWMDGILFRESLTF